MGNYGFPVLGHVMSSLADPLDFARRRYARYGPVSGRAASVSGSSR
jgi:hypothetical protein